MPPFSTPQGRGIPVCQQTLQISEEPQLRYVADKIKTQYVNENCHTMEIPVILNNVEESVSVYQLLRLNLKSF